MMPEVQPLSLAEARSLCADNYTKGLAYYKDGAVGGAWRTTATLHASVKGSARQPYEASAGPREDGSYWGRCNCPAARRQGICKHAAALLVAWAEKPEMFALRAEPEAAPQGGPKLESEAKRVRTPKVDRRLLLAEGLGKAEALLVELASRGLLSTTQQQVTMVGSLAETLEAHRLRRLFRQVAEIQRAAGLAQVKDRQFDERGWARLLCDTWFVLSATRKALEKEEEADRSDLEELVGKTWLEKDLRRVENLSILELAYETAVLPSGFRVETSFLLDMDEGTLYTEKQITPLRLKDAPRKRSYSLPLCVAVAGIYPGFAPLRVKLIQAEEMPPARETWDRAAGFAEASAAALRQRLSQATASLVAPQEAYSLFRPASIQVDGDSLHLLDGEGKAIPIAGGQAGRWGLRGALARGPVAAVLCRVSFAEGGMEAEPLSVILREGEAEDRLVRLTA